MRNGYKLLSSTASLDFRTISASLETDQSPNRYETYLIITARRNVYKDYVAEFKRRQQPYVQESVFSNLWVTIFPRYINRPWCDIPGRYVAC